MISNICHFLPWRAITKSLLVLVLSGTAFGQALQAVIYPDKASNLVGPLAWVKNFTDYGGVTWDTSSPANWINYLDGTGTTGGTPPYSCAWTITAGPNSPTITSPSNCLTTVTGPATTLWQTNDFTAHLVVIDNVGAMSSKDMHIGALPCDRNGLVVQAASVSKIVRSMNCLGRNITYGYEQERHLKASLSQDYGPVDTYFPWRVKGAGTVSYTIGGVGSSFSPTSTTLTADVAPTDTVIHIANASVLDLSSLPGTPTRILMFKSDSVVEEARICSASSTTGASDLTTCFDGRGTSQFGSNSFSPPYPTAAQSIPSGSKVGQFKVIGSGTSFLTDANRALCPMGAATPMGGIYYNTGTVAVGSNSTTVTLSMGTFPTDVATHYIVIKGMTHDTGQPYVLVRAIASRTNGTTLVLDRATLAATDSGLTGLTYAILDLQTNSQIVTSARVPVLEYTASDGFTGRRLFNGYGCESETAAYGTFIYDMGALNGTPSGAQKYSYKTILGVGASNASNFYGNPHLSLHLQSGLRFPLAQAETMNDNYPLDPEIDRTGFGEPLQSGGGIVTSWMQFGLDPSTTLVPLALRPSAEAGIAQAARNCNVFDTRDSTYLFWPTGLAYILDSTISPSTHWKDGVTAIYNWDTVTSNGITASTGCKQSDNSWANNLNWVPTNGLAHVDVLQNSDVVTAHSPDTFGTNICYDVAHGAATATQNSATLTSSAAFTSHAGVGLFIITGTRSGSSFTEFLTGTYSSTSLVNLSAQWIGDSGAVTFVEEDITNGVNGNTVTIADAAESPLLLQKWGCSRTDSTHLKLHKNWTSATNNGGTYVVEASATIPGVGPGGYNQLCYQLGGIRIRFMDVLAHSVDFASQYTTLRSGAATWLHDTCWETDTYSLSYVRGGEDNTISLPLGSSSGYGAYQFRTAGWGQTGGAAASITFNREITAEAIPMLRAYSDAYGNGAVTTDFVDKVCGGIWGYSTWTLAGYYAGATYQDGNAHLTDAALAGGKWTGFYFNIGGSWDCNALAAEQRASSPATRYPSVMRRPANSR